MRCVIDSKLKGFPGFRKNCAFSEMKEHSKLLLFIERNTHMYSYYYDLLCCPTKISVTNSTYFGQICLRFSIQPSICLFDHILIQKYVNMQLSTFESKKLAIWSKLATLTQMYLFFQSTATAKQKFYDALTQYAGNWVKLRHIYRQRQVCCVRTVVVALCKNMQGENVRGVRFSGKNPFRGKESITP